MYLDSYVISSLIIILLTIVVVVYIGWFGYRHIRQDMKKNEGKQAVKNSEART